MPGVEREKETDHSVSAAASLAPSRHFVAPLSQVEGTIYASSWWRTDSGKERPGRHFPRQAAWSPNSGREILIAESGLIGKQPLVVPRQAEDGTICSQTPSWHKLGGRTPIESMQNCYNTNARAGQRAAEAAASDIDERLTRRHLETLEFAQEIVRQNRELKAAVQTLEQQLLAAEDSNKSNRKSQMEEETQQRLKEMQDLCNRRVDEAAKQLAEQHERELAALLQDRAEAERAWHSSRQQEQAEFVKLQMALRDRNELASQLEARVGQQTEALAAETERAASLEAALAAAVKERDSARRALAAAEEHRREEQAAQHELSAERQKCAELRLRLEQLARDRDADNQAEAERQRQLDDSQRQLEQLLERAEQLERRLADAERRLAEARSNESRLTSENAALEAEIEALRSAAKRQQQTSKQQQQQQQQQTTSARETPTGGGDANFREFVAVKRELAALREENERLRARLRTAGSTGGKARN